jgi:hypothetical protein
MAWEIRQLSNEKFNTKKTLYNICLTGPQKHRNQYRSQSQNVVGHYDGRHTKLILGRSLTGTGERA